jgi:hypothetical protein
MDRDSQQKSVTHPQLKTLSFNNTALMSLGMDGNWWIVLLEELCGMALHHQDGVSSVDVIILRCRNLN